MSIVQVAKQHLHTKGMARDTREIMEKLIHEIERLRVKLNQREQSDIKHAVGWAHCIAEKDKLKAEIERLRADAADSDLLFGAGWQESLKAANGNPHEAMHSQCVKLAGDNAELSAEVERLRGEIKQAVETDRLLAEAEMEGDRT